MHNFSHFRAVIWVLEVSLASSREVAVEFCISRNCFVNSSIYTMSCMMYRGMWREVTTIEYHRQEENTPF